MSSVVSICQWGGGVPPCAGYQSWLPSVEGPAPPCTHSNYEARIVGKWTVGIRLKCLSLLDHSVSQHRVNFLLLFNCRWLPGKRDRFLTVVTEARRGEIRGDQGLDPPLPGES